MALFGKKEPAYVPVGRGYEIPQTGVALRTALLNGEPKEVVELAPAAAAQSGNADTLAVRVGDLLRAFLVAHNGDLQEFVALTCQSPLSCPPPQNEDNEPEQYVDHACERLFIGALLMDALSNERHFGAPQYQLMLDTFVDTFKWTRSYKHLLRTQNSSDFDVIVGMGKHFHTFDEVVGRLISDNNLRKANARRTSD